MADNTAKTGLAAWVAAIRTRLQRHRLRTDRNKAYRDLIDRNDGHLLDDIGIANENRPDAEKPGTLEDKLLQRPWQL